MKIPIVNEQDEIIKVIDSSERKKDDICRVSALWVTNIDGNILLAQRAFSKKNSPGLWGPAVAGTVEEGETYELNVIKEAEEEIKLTELKPISGPKIRRSTSHEYFVQWFTAVVDYNYPFIKQDTEVEKIQWFTKDEILKLLKEKPEIFVTNLKQDMNFF
jgi:isopentenyldiphosphate isomerase